MLALRSTSTKPFVLMLLATPLLSANTVGDDGGSFAGQHSTHIDKSTLNATEDVCNGVEATHQLARLS
jgi:hypothetical protein